MISEKKYYITIAVLVAIAAASFFSGMKLGNKGYTYSGGNYKIINQNDYPKDVDYSLLWKTLETLNAKYIDKPLDQQKLLYGAVSGLVSATGDPYTAFFDPKQYSDFRTELSGVFEGIGAEVGIKDRQIIVVTPLDGTPAKKAGILAGDYILKVDGVETAGMSLDEVVSKIRGARGTKVTLSIYRDSTNETKDYTITRQKIEVTSVKTETRDINGSKIMIINIQRFSDDTLDLFRQAAINAQAQNIKGIVVDLRGDPGGYLDTAVKIASYWVAPGQTVVTEVRSDGSKQDFPAVGNNTLNSMPTVVLMNGGSASAAEILAGALRDYNFAKIVGEKSFGKGSVQELVNLPYSTALKVTVAKWLTPKGKNINKEGLEPDIKIERTAEQIEKNEDPQMDKALELLR